MLLGIDIGTSTLKGMLFDPEEGTVVALERLPVNVYYPAEDKAEGDPREWWQAFCNVCMKLKENHPAAFKKIGGVGFSTIFPAVLPLDADGNALHNALLYCDRRAMDEMKWVCEAFGEEAFETVTGNRLTVGTCSLPGILWFRKHAPEIAEKTAVFGHVSTYMLFHLTGVFGIDYSHASLSGLTRTGQEEQWDPEILRVFEIADEKLPQLFASDEVVGEVGPEAAEECGLPPGVPVVAGAGDAPCSAFGGGVFDAGSLFAAAGSTDCIMYADAVPSGNPVFANIRYCLSDLWLANGAMTSAGASVKWFCENMMHCGSEDMRQWAEQVEADAHIPVFLPYLQGERTPWWDPEAEGVFFGLHMNAGREHLSRSVYEGVGFAWRQIVRLLEQQHDFTAAAIITAGGNCENALWNQIKASVLNVPLKVVHFTETSALGACMLVGLGSGVLKNKETVREINANIVDYETVEPVPSWVTVYDEKYQKYEALYPALRDIFHQ